MGKITFLVLTSCMILLNSCAPTTKKYPTSSVKYPASSVVYGCNVMQLLHTLATEKLVSTGNGDDMILATGKTVGGSKITREYADTRLTEALEKKQISQSQYDMCMK